jgi:hypothetical protein
MANRIKPFTVADFLLICALSGCAAFFVPFMQSHTPDTVAVYRDNASIARYPLGEDRCFYVQGHYGPMKIRIKDKAVSVDSVTCPERICKRTRPISRTSQQIICEPNHIVVEVSPTKETLDGVSR